MSGRMTGDGYFRIAQAMIESGFRLPTSDKKSVNVTRLAEAIGIPTQSIYKNPRIRQLIEVAAVQQGLFPLGSSTDTDDSASAEIQPAVQASASASKRLERHAQNLELQNAALVAENSAFRQKLKELVLQLGREDMTIDTGRRVADPRLK